MDSMDDESANDVNNDNGAEGLHQFYYQYLNKLNDKQFYVFLFVFSFWTKNSFQNMCWEICYFIIYWNKLIKLWNTKKSDSMFSLNW